ncbi:hypothetical protein BAE44_0013437 [Dichanthelium oligosanthes]|uniref:DUF547 domain-containing protein n=1 Tax=Dichanthelium oligosanthes TaxID=888268 RepID=A0A1E5VKE6_9POAL|nr:hypothetical protein BAE44_0013437 [Dichanthelium oligosanthes]
MEYVVARVSQQQQPYTAVPQQPQLESVADHRPPPVSQRTRRGSSATAAMTAMTMTMTMASTQQRRRQALEQEVAELKQQLSDEQTVHHILERALQPSSARSAVLTIPAFIPTKAKELLAELLLVEEEIARLEEQIQTMKISSAMPPQLDAPPTTIAKSPRPSAAASDSSNTNAQLQHPQKAAEIKSMFFISQAMAMDGDYLNKQKNAKSPPKAAAAAASPKNNIFALPPPSSRHSLDKQQQPAKILHHELPISKQIPSNTKSRHDQPNKLSERIVKCLVCIFIRLLRSSRVAELEKSGNLARSGNMQGGSSFSFRIDTGLNVAATVAKDKDRGQQDHYGIFAIPDAIVRDIGPYKNLVRFTSSSFDLRGFSSSPLLTKLREMLQALQQVDLRVLNHQQKLAFWLNVYNTCIMHVRTGLITSPSFIINLQQWDSAAWLALKLRKATYNQEQGAVALEMGGLLHLVQATINVSGQKFNALVIENFILRQPSSVKEEFWKCDVDVEEQQVRELYGLKTSEPNILFALCCGIRSSPALRIYKADRVAMDLEKAKLEYLQASLVVTSTRRLLVPSLIHSSMHDFAKDMESLLRWICEQLPTSWSLRKSMVDCLSLQRGQQQTTTTHHLKTMLMEEVIVDVMPFDYEFQYLLPM